MRLSGLVIWAWVDAAPRRRRVAASWRVVRMVVGDLWFPHLRIEMWGTRGLWGFERNADSLRE
jgi:hypothetical protein